MDTEPILPRDVYNGGDVYSMDQCLKDCMLYPRPYSTFDYYHPADFGTNLGSDTIWCRMRHLGLAIQSNTSYTFDQAFHCPHAGPNGGGICRDALVNGYTPYELQRQGAATGRRLGYCVMSTNDTVADCTKAFLNDTSFPLALSLIPYTTQVLIVNNNPKITMLPSGIFSGLRNPSGVKALIMDDCGIKTIDSNAFAPLTNLQVLNLNQNKVQTLPTGMLSRNGQLKQFSMFGAGEAYTQLTGLPEDLFFYTPLIERIVMYGHPNITSFPPNVFRDLFHCEIISFVNCGITNAGIPDGVFSNLTSLLFFDFFGNQLTKAEARWFEGGWASNVLRVALNFNRDLNTIDSDIFATLTNLEFAYFHATALDTIPDGLFNTNNNLVLYTLGYYTGDLVLEG